MLEHRLIFLDLILPYTGIIYTIKYYLRIKFVQLNLVLMFILIEPLEIQHTEATAFVHFNTIQNG